MFNLMHVQAHRPMASFSFKEGLIRQKNVEKTSTEANGAFLPEKEKLKSTY